VEAQPSGGHRRTVALAAALFARRSHSLRSKTTCRHVDEPDVADLDPDEGSSEEDVIAAR